MIQNTWTWGRLLISRSYCNAVAGSGLNLLTLRCTAARARVSCEYLRDCLCRFCTDPSPPSKLALRQCAPLTVSTDCSRVQRAELGTEQRDRTASCHPVPCVEAAAAKAVGSVAVAAEFSPASSGHRRRAWSKRLQEPVSARASPSSRVCVLRSVCLNGDSSSDFELKSARSYIRTLLQ